MKKYKLGEICTIVPGYAFKAADFGKGLNYVIKIKDIMPPYIDILHSEKVETIIDKKLLLSGKLQNCRKIQPEAL